MSDSAATAPGRAHLSSREPGCPVNLALTNRIQNYLALNGWTLHEPESADLIVIVACSQLPTMRHALVASVRDYAQRFPSKTTIVTCCFVPQDKVEAPNVVYIPLAKTDEFDRWFHPAIPLCEVSSGATMENDRQIRSLKDNRRSLYNQKYNVLVSAGCLNNCAFCSGKSMFPTVRSVPLANVIAECKEGLRKGYTTFVIGSSDVASYGRDLGCTVTDLFAALFTDAFDGRPDLVVGMKGIEPSGLLRHFDDLKHYFRSGRIKWVDLPIQSGSDSVLRSMNRRYRVADVLRVVRELRELAPGIRITTDVIFCYPTETAEDFEASLTLFEHFDYVQMLQFQPHEGTKAATLAYVFDDDERARRQAVVDTLARARKELPQGAWTEPPPLDGAATTKDSRVP